MKKKHVNRILFLFLSIIECNCFALSQDEKVWLGINAKQTLTENWSTYIFSQMRFKSQSELWQVGLIEGAIGYHFIKNQSFWVGYRWSGINPFDGFYEENRFFQQFINALNIETSHQLVLRSRLEEIRRGNDSQISVRLRERLSLQIENASPSNNLKPYFYDEIFFQLHATVYTTENLFDQNRIFIGFNLFTSNKTWWEIGYLNQFQMKTPGESQNKMSHIVSFTYNLS